MERIKQTQDLVELGDAIEQTRGVLPAGVPDTDGIQFQFGAGLSHDD